MIDVGYISTDRTSASGSTVTSQTFSLVSSSKTEAKASAAASAYKIEVITPYVKVDDDANLAILEYRSNQTGEVVRQYPSKVQIKAFKEAEQIRAASEAKADAASRAERKATTEISSTFSAESSVKPVQSNASNAAASYAAAPTADTAGSASSSPESNSILV